MQTIDKAPVSDIADSKSEASQASSSRCVHPKASFTASFPARDYITGDKFVVGFCSKCGFHVTAPVPADGRISGYYPAAYYGESRRFNPAVEWLLHKLYDFRVGYIENRQKPGKVLDVGCGRGLFLEHLRKRGWDTVGTELSEDSATYARDVLKLPVYAQPLEEIGFPDNEFDLVVLWHVLEHVPDPQGLLAEIGRILKPGGMLLLAIPNFGSWEAQWGRNYWFHLDVPRHLTHFTRATLEAALKSTGLDIKGANFFSSEYDFYSFVQTVQNKMGFGQNLLYNLLRSRSAKFEHAGSEAGPGRIALALLTAPFLVALSFLYAPVVAALGKGATMTVYAVKSSDERGKSPDHIK